MQEEDQFDCKYASFPLEDEKALLKKKIQIGTSEAY